MILSRAQENLIDGRWYLAENSAMHSICTLRCTWEMLKLKLGSEPTFGQHTRIMNMKMTAKPLIAVAALAILTGASVAYAQTAGSGAMTKPAPAATESAGSGTMNSTAATNKNAGSGAMNTTAGTAENAGSGAATAGSGAMNAGTSAETADSGTAGSGTAAAGSGTMTNSATMKKDGAMEQTMSKDAMPKPAAAPRGSN